VTRRRNRALRSLPPVEYANIDEVIHSVNADVGSGPVDAVHADPHRKPPSPDVAERPRWRRAAPSGSSGNLQPFFRVSSGTPAKVW
jgi:hypothetical protein